MWSVQQKLHAILNCTNQTPLCPSPAQRYSHLYSSPGRVVGTFQRIDIPTLPQLLQFEFVLFTGAARAASGCRALVRAQLASGSLGHAF